jgi:hypothetical protein
METLTEPQWRFVLGLATRIVPEVTGLDGAAEARFRAIIDEALAARPPQVRRQLGLFLTLLRWLPALRYGAPFERLDAARQEAVLAWFHDCPAGRLRQGFWGLKTLVFMGYYGRAEAGEGLGYAPSFSGNERLAAGS